MKVALGQFAVEIESEKNLLTCLDLMQKSQQAGADLLVLPEGICSRNIADPELVLKAAQAIDGPFITRLAEATVHNALTVVFCMHVPVPDKHNKVWNVQVVLAGGKVAAAYKKLHLYDAFATRESDYVEPGSDVPPLLNIAGFKVGLMTCYDLRFPELARRLCSDGAEVLLCPSAWLKGPLKEHHWQVLNTARALENTAYMVSAGECGPRNIGMSMVVDPLGVVVAQAAENPALLFCELDKARVEHARRVLPVLQNRRFIRPELQTKKTA